MVECQEELSMNQSEPSANAIDAVRPLTTECFKRYAKPRPSATNNHSSMDFTNVIVSDLGLMSTM